MTLEPQVRFQDIYGEGHFIAPRLLSPGGYESYHGEVSLVDGYALGCLPLAGSLPILVPSGFVTAETRWLHELAEMPFPSDVRSYESSSDYLRKVNRLWSEGSRAVVFEPPAVQFAAEGRFAVERHALSRMNDKSRLAEFVPPEGLLLRTGFLRGLDRHPALPYPFVLKTAFHSTPARGRGARLCRDVAEFERALQELSPERCFVIEEFVPDARCFRLNFTVDGKGLVVYTGSAEAARMRNGQESGHWHDTGVVPTPHAVTLAKAAAQAMAREGFQGFVGVVMLLAEADDVSHVIEIDTRVEDVTLGALLAPKLHNRFQASVFRSARFGTTWCRSTLAVVAESLLKEGLALPRGIHRSRRPRQENDIVMWVFGDNRAQVEAREVRIATILEATMAQGSSAVAGQLRNVTTGLRRRVRSGG